MTFAEVLPALRDGGKVRRAVWPSGAWTDRAIVDDRRLALGALLASDWELVEEPADVHANCRENFDRHRATIARLERERDLLKLTVKTCEEVSAALERELADVRERLEFSRAGNATLTECGADTVRQLAEAKRAVATFGRELEANRSALHDAWQRIDAAYKALP